MLHSLVASRAISLALLRPDLSVQSTSSKLADDRDLPFIIARNRDGMGGCHKTSDSRVWADFLRGDN